MDRNILLGKGFKFPSFLSPIMLLVLNGCILGGGMGHIAQFEFFDNKYNVERDLIHVVDSINSTYSSRRLPLPTIDSFSPIEVYNVAFPTPPYELYQLFFKYDTTVWNSSNRSTLFLLGVNYGDGFKFYRDISKREKQRIVKRVEEEVLTNLHLAYHRID